MTTTISEVKERPILFSTPMVKAILEGRKTVTRRVIKDESVIDTINIISEKGPLNLMYRDWCEEDPEVGDGVHAAEWLVYDEEKDWVYPMGQGYGNEGDILWVRETFAIQKYFNGLREECFPVFKTDYPGPVDWNWKPSIFMLKEYCRLRLKIKSIRVERLHDITEEDAIREGLAKITKDGGRTWKYGIPDKDGLPGTDDHGWPWTDWNTFANEAFFTLWKKINGEESFQANPWVWRIEFEKIETGLAIDATKI